MPQHDETLERLESRDFDAIEDAWLEHLDRAPTDADYFVAVAQTLAEASQVESVRPLLRLLDEELAEKGAHEARLTLLLETGDLFLKSSSQHDEVVGVLEALYSSSKSLPDMLRIAGLHRVSPDARTLRRHVERLRSLMLLDVGSLVHMEGKGVGTIAEINFDLGRYKIDFASIPALTVGFRAGAKLLEPIPTRHVLRTKIEDPGRLESLRDDDPSELLREVLESYPEPLTAAQIKAALDGVVPAGAWSRWWTAARKHPQVLVTSEKRQRYGWAATSGHAAATLTDAFDKAGLDGQLEIFNKNAKQNPQLAGTLAATLSEQAESLVSQDPARALAVWLALSRAGLAAPEAAFSPRAVLDLTEDVVVLVGKLSQKVLRQSLYEAVREERSDWVGILGACALAEEDPALVDRLIETLSADGPDHRKRIADRALSRPQAHPGAFVWLVKTCSEDEALRRPRALSLFRQLLATSGRPEFASYRAALGPLIESGGTLAKLVADLSDGDAEPALDAVRRSTLEEYLRTPLINALELRFESLRDTSDNTLYALPASIDARKEEVRRLREVEIPQNRQAIQEAAALGDLRENFEYKSARQRHEYLSARLAGMMADLARVQPIDLDSTAVEQVRVGSTVELESDDRHRVITILGPWESDPEAGRLSYQSEMGQRLMGGVVGDEVELEDGRHRITAIRTFEAS